MHEMHEMHEATLPLKHLVYKYLAELAAAKNLPQLGFNVKCDSTNNTPEMIANNQLMVHIEISDPVMIERLRANNQLNAILPES